MIYSRKGQKSNQKQIPIITKKLYEPQDCVLEALQLRTFKIPDTEERFRTQEKAEQKKFKEVVD